MISEFSEILLNIDMSQVDLITFVFRPPKNAEKHQKLVNKISHDDTCFVLSDALLREQSGVKPALKMSYLYGSSSCAEQCIICQCDYEEGDMCARSFRCSHMWHNQCIRDAIFTRSVSECPICRQTLRENNTHRMSIRLSGRLCSPANDKCRVILYRIWDIVSSLEYMFWDRLSKNDIDGAKVIMSRILFSPYLKLVYKIIKCEPLSFEEEAWASASELFCCTSKDRLKTTQHICLNTNSSICIKKLFTPDSFLMSAAGYKFTNSTGLNNNKNNDLLENLIYTDMNTPSMTLRQFKAAFLSYLSLIYLPVDYSLISTHSTVPASSSDFSSSTIHGNLFCDPLLVWNCNRRPFHSSVLSWQACVKLFNSPSHTEAWKSCEWIHDSFMSSPSADGVIIRGGRWEMVAKIGVEGSSILSHFAKHQVLQLANNLYISSQSFLKPPGVLRTSNKSEVDAVARQYWMKAQKSLIEDTVLFNCYKQRIDSLLEVSESFLWHAAVSVPRFNNEFDCSSSDDGVFSLSSFSDGDMSFMTPIPVSSHDVCFVSAHSNNIQINNEKSELKDSITLDTEKLSRQSVIPLAISSSLCVHMERYIESQFGYFLRRLFSHLCLLPACASSSIQKGLHRQKVSLDVVLAVDLPSLSFHENMFSVLSSSSSERHQSDNSKPIINSPVLRDFTQSLPMLCHSLSKTPCSLKCIPKMVDGADMDDRFPLSRLASNSMPSFSSTSASIVSSKSTLSTSSDDTIEEKCTGKRLNNQSNQEKTNSAIMTRKCKIPTFLHEDLVWWHLIHLQNRIQGSEERESNIWTSDSWSSLACLSQSILIHSSL